MDEGAVYLIAQAKMRLPLQLDVTRGYWQKEVNEHIVPISVLPI